MQFQQKVYEELLLWGKNLRLEEIANKAEGK